MADAYINLIPGFKYWDMCASEALIEAKMGICVQADGSPLVYDHTDKSHGYTVQGGIIIAKNMLVYNLVRNRLLKNLGMTLEQFKDEVLEDVAQYRAKKAAKEAERLQEQLKMGNQ